MNSNIELKDIHWLIDMVHNIDVGLVIIDLDLNVKVWNGFMENHSGLLTKHMVDKKLTDVFSDIPKEWLQKKIDSVCLLKNKAFTTWEQRPYLFQFKSYRPITSNAEFMYQNVTFLPLTEISGEVSQICMIIYDVTDVALNRQAFQDANQQLEHLSHTDALTQLYNQGYWRECCELEFKRHQRSDRAASMLLLDIDKFKSINDTYGHPFGDEVIRGIAKCIHDNKREIDIAGRFGGEEFAMLIIDAELEGAKAIAERLRQAIEELEFSCNGEQIKITASFGIAQITQSVPDHNTWIKRADEGLYQAKHNGRNQVCSVKH